MLTRPVRRVATATFPSPTVHVSSLRKSVSTCPRLHRPGDRMRRCFFLALTVITLALACAGALADVSSHRPLIALLLGGSQATVGRWLGGFPEELHALGYVEHRDYEIEYRYADGDLGRLPRLAAELALLHPDVIVVGGTAAALASKRAGPSVPIVIAAATNPVQFGLARDLARPGGNVTGMLAGFESLAGKQLELGLQLLPGKQRVGMLLNTSNVASDVHRQNVETAAQTKAAELSSVTASIPMALGAAMHELANRRVDYVIVPADAMFLSERQRIAELALAVKLPPYMHFGNTLR